jgi:hypothetical protein
MSLLLRDAIRKATLMTGEFSWWSIVPTLVGGAISIATTVAVFRFNIRVDRTKREREQKKSAANRAFFGLMKLNRTLESIENLARHFDEQLAEAQSIGRGHLEPYDVYRALVGAPHPFDLVSAEEILFLTKGHGEMIARIGEIQQRATNNEFIAREYASARRALDAFLLEHISTDSLVDGASLYLNVDSALKVKIDFQQGQLNQMIVPLIAALEEDRITVVTLIKEYIKLAKLEFGDDFPTKGLELRKSGKKC